VIRLADEGPAAVAQSDPGVAKGFNVTGGKVTCEPVAEYFGLPYTPLADALG